ncbi:MAG: cysteine rich repeat-containing protein [Proteobacteria bacterium]|nr:cysteine rich repeat-containing protein [Pseudomonadota bacterium]
MIIRTTLAFTLIAASIPAFAGGSQLDADFQALRTYCKADVERLCAGVEPGGGRIKACLMANKEQMSVGCAQALMKLKGTKNN